VTVAAKTFSDLLGRLDPPMFVVTVVAEDGERSGCLIGFATQRSIRPARFLVCVSVRNRTAAVIARASHAIKDRDVDELGFQQARSIEPGHEA